MSTTEDILKKLNDQYKTVGKVGEQGSEVHIICIEEGCMHALDKDLFDEYYELVEGNVYKLIAAGV